MDIRGEQLISTWGTGEKPEEGQATGLIARLEVLHFG